MLILKNLLRRKVRTALSVLGIAIGIAAIIAFNAVASGFKESLNQYARETGAHLMVLVRDVPSAEYSRISREEADEIARMDGVLESSGSTFYMMMMKGFPAFILFGREPDGRPMQRYRNREFRGELVRAEDELLLGSEAAQKLKKNVGDEIELFDRKKFRVVGIYTVGTVWENVGAVVHLRVVQQKLRMGDSIQLAFIYLKDPATRERTKAEIERRFPHLVAVRSEELAGNFENLAYIDWFVWVVSLIAVAVGGLGVLNTMLMTVSERTREIGTLRAVGWSCRRVLGLVLSEGVLISVVGGALGLVAGWLGAELLIRWAPKGYLGTFYSVTLFMKAMAVALGLGFVGTLYPAFRASRLSPIEALKYE
ncbi:MAG: ABC transporter permease [Planctomycetes bacterium]|nr:ABC transporter permease [Planctomycetota bacterium]